MDAHRQSAERWLAQFEQALRAPDDKPLRALFHADSHWRDVLALTGSIRTVSGTTAHLPELKHRAAQRGARNFRLDPSRTAPRQVMRAGTDAIEAIFTFETDEGRCNGVLRLTPVGDAPKAWTLLTALDAIKGHEEHVGRARPKGESYSRDFRGPNWLDLRQAAARYEDRDPAP